MSITATADPSQPDEVTAAAVTAITETINAASRPLLDARQPLVDRFAPWRITGTPYSAARLTIGDLATRIADLPEHLPVLLDVPDWDCRDITPLRSTTWDGALVLTATQAEPGPDTLPLDLPLADDEEPAAAPEPAGRLAQTGVLTVGDLAAVLADLPDHAPVMAVVPGWNGTAELVLERADDYGDCLLLDTDYPTCDPFSSHDED